MYQNIYFLIKNNNKKQKKDNNNKKEKKQEDKKKQYVLLTYLIESWISPGCSFEFNVVYVPREKNFCYATTTYEVHTFKNQNGRKSLRDIWDAMSS